MIVKKSSIPLDFKSSYWEENYKDLRNYILYELGYPLVKIELTDFNLNNAIYEAITRYISYYTLEYFFEKLGVNEGGWADIPPHIEIPLIRDIIFQTNIFDLNPYSGIPTDTMAINQPISDLLNNFNIENYIMTKQSIDIFRQSIGGQRSWEIIDKKIKIYPSRAVDNTIGVLYGKIPLPEELEGDEWVRAFAVAKAKTILGGIRSKFSNYSIASGNAATDGEALKSEGKEAMDKLMEEIKFHRSSGAMFQF